MEDLSRAPARYFMPYHVWRWVACFSVMVGLIPMAGTMTSFGSIKTAIQAVKNCTPSDVSSRPPLSTNKNLNISADARFLRQPDASSESLAAAITNESDCREWDNPAFVGFADLDPTVLSFVASLVFGFTVGSSVVTSPIIAKLGYRNSGIAGCLLGAVVSIWTSYSSNFYVWFFSYSFCFGIANNLIYNTGMQMANALFPTEYNTAATVIASFGISLGTAIMNPVSTYVTDNFGWRNRFRVCALMQFCVSLPAVLFWGQPWEEKASKKKNKKDEEAELVEQQQQQQTVEALDDGYNMCTDIVFWAWLLGTTFWSLDFVIPLDFAMDFMTQGKIERSSAAAVMSAFGISELISRIVCAVTGEQKLISKPVIYILSSVVGAVGFLIPIVANNGTEDGGKMSLGLMYTFAIVVGFVGGVLNCLIMACTVDVFGQQRTIKVWNYVSIMLGVGFVGGPPIGAFFVNTIFEGEIVYVFYIAIAFFLVCSLTMAPIPIYTKRRETRAVESTRDNRQDDF